MTHIEIGQRLQILRKTMPLLLASAIDDIVETSFLIPGVIISRLNQNLYKIVVFEGNYLNSNVEESQEELENIWNQFIYDTEILVPQIIKYLENDIPLIKDISMDSFNNVLGIKNSPKTFKNVSCKEIKGVEVLCSDKNIFNDVKKEILEIYEIDIPIFGSYLYTGKSNDIEIKRVIFEDNSIWNAPLNLKSI